LRASKKFEADLIVIGSRGLRGLPRALLGSTAERVVRYSNVPVTTLHGPVEDACAADVKTADDLVDRWLI
jgi:nucleotide-binding universal stress UspA family protein